MQLVDIRQEKLELRNKYKRIREGLNPEDKENFDEKIFRKVTQLWAYREEGILLTYVSLKNEVDTKMLIGQAIKDGKRVAVPRCIYGTRNMNFYFIESFDDLEIGSFGVLEPSVDKCEKLRDYSCGLCIVPALAFDKRGFRLGYGKGYYDRFLGKFGGKVIGICYSDCTCDFLPNGKFDRNVTSIVTERNVITTGK